MDEHEPEALGRVQSKRRADEVADEAGAPREAKRWGGGSRVGHAAGSRYALLGVLSLCVPAGGMLAPETDQPVSTATPSAPSVSQQRLHSPNASAADESHASGVCLAASPAATPAEPACRRRPKTRGGRRAHAPTFNH